MTSESRVHEVTSTVSPYSRWRGLTEAIRGGGHDAEAELYEALSGFKIMFTRQLGADAATDCYHDLIVTIIRTVRSGALHEPARLMGFARATAQHMIVDQIRAMRRLRPSDAAQALTPPDSSPSAETKAIWKEFKEIAGHVLLGMPTQDRRLLIRYYFDGHDAQRIRADLGLSENQFRLLKSRAKARFTSRLRRRLGPGTGLFG